jgi:cardiolipin synthase
LPLMHAIRRARKAIDIVIFRFDRLELERAIAQAVTRGVAVRALVAKTNRGGEKRLRKLEMSFLDAGVTVCRTDDDLTRYHGKIMIVDGVLYVLGFNYTELDMDRSRSFGLVTREPAVVKAAAGLFEADAARQPYESASDRLVVSPESSRKLLGEFIRGARRELLIYDPKISDRSMLDLIRDRVTHGVTVRVIGSTSRRLDGVDVRKPSKRLHVRAIVRDRKAVFIGSQSLRRPQLDGRREIGLIAPKAAVAAAVARVFMGDWGREKDEAADVKASADAAANP